MGRQKAQEKLFYQFRLEDHVPSDHPLRQLDAVLKFERARTVLAGHYSRSGRPSVDPELMLRMLLVGYAYGIRSERQLCNEVHLNLAYRWFCRLGLEGTVPDHSTFSKNRHGRFRESDVYRVLFEEVVEQCRQAGIVSGEGFAVDGSFVHGDARRDRRVQTVESIREGDTSARPVWEYLQALDAGNPAYEGGANIYLQLIPPLPGTPRKGAVALGTSPTTWSTPRMPSSSMSRLHPRGWRRRSRRPKLCWSGSRNATGSSPNVWRPIWLMAPGPFSHGSQRAPSHRIFRCWIGNSRPGACSPRGFHLRPRTQCIYLSAGQDPKAPDRASERKHTYVSGHRQ
jgi:transposase